MVGRALCVRGDHPRSRGVYGSPVRARCTGQGSSPLARGLPMRALSILTAARIIPARAGFTTRRAPGSCARGDHPRSRGVYQAAGGEANGVWGSSPLARGLPVNRGMTTVVEGIIPARAGFTAAPSPPASPAADHPRSRGVYNGDGNVLLSAVGSSPLARGLPPHCTEPASGGGIIPARAGFTQSGHLALVEAQDHPRSRGVYRRSAAQRS